MLFKELPNASSFLNGNSLILVGAILMALGICVPCLIWLARNLIRVIQKKDFWWLNTTLKISWIIGIIIFMIGLVILIVKLVLGD